SRRGRRTPARGAERHERDHPCCARRPTHGSTLTHAAKSRGAPWTLRANDTADVYVDAVRPSALLAFVSAITAAPTARAATVAAPGGRIFPAIAAGNDGY